MQLFTASVAKKAKFFVYFPSELYSNFCSKAVPTVSSAKKCLYFIAYSIAFCCSTLWYWAVFTAKNSF